MEDSSAEPTAPVPGHGSSTSDEVDRTPRAPLRLAAAAIDVVIARSVAVGAGVVILHTPLTSPALAAVPLWLTFLSLLAVVALPATVCRGRTFGKQVAGLQVTTASATSPGWRAGAKYTAMAALIVAPVVGEVLVAVLVVAAAGMPARRSVFDLAFGTRVLRQTGSR